MKNLLKLFVAAIVYSIIFNSCETPNDPKINETGSGNNTQSGNVIVTGLVRNANTGDLLDSATVFINFGSGTVSGTTTSGRYTLSFTLDSSRTVTMIISKVNYKTDTTQIFASVNSTNNISTILLAPVVSVTRKSGPPAAIYLLSQSTSSLGVQGSGSVETGRITFQVVESAGNNIDIANSSLVKFTLDAKPDGGEFISPSLAFTDSSGQASVFLTSGTKAGVVQIRAEINLTGRTIISQPVSYAIHGGLPQQDHFGLATQFLNFPGYNIFGLQNTITAYLGDKYGNPVRPNTTVYYTTTGGIIEGSAQTNALGVASATLLSAEPRPTHATLGPGFATVTASTADETSTIISNNVVVLFSGVPTIQISPTSFNIPNGGTQTFLYEVKDQNENPLAGNTQITVAIEGENIDAGGDLSVVLPDTQSRAWTRFSFYVYDTADTVDLAKPVSIKITTNGPNGGAFLTINGISR